MTEEDHNEMINELEQHLKEKEREMVTMADAMDKYDLIGAHYDPVHGSYMIMADRDPKMTSSAAMRELGYASPSPFTSWTRDERVPELRDQMGIRTYYDMKRADGIIRSLLRYIKTPVLSARWFVEPATDSTIDQNIAKFVEETLFEKIASPWHRILEDALLMCEYGYSPLEKVFDIDTDGRMILTKLAPRHPLDIKEWVYDAEGGPNGIVMNPTEMNGWQDIFIPIEKLVVFVLEQEAGDMRGISILRSAYKHYYYRDCTSEDTEILTKHGWLLHNQVMQGDEALTLNPDTGLAEWNEVKYVRRYPGTHDAIQMESNNMSSITTPDHRWLVKDGTWASPYEFVTTEYLRQRHIIPCAAPNADIPSEPKFTDALVELVGWFITEGSWQGYSSTIAQNANSPHINRLRACLRSLFGSPYRNSSLNSGRRDLPPGWYERVKNHDPNGVQFKLNAGATSILRQYVEGKNKIATNDFILSLTKAQLRLFIDSCFYGDGCANKFEIRQNDKHRLEPIALACILLGWGVNYNQWKSADPRYPDTTVYQLLISRNRIGAKPIQSKARYGSKVDEIIYNGIVWCPKTDNGTWLARRNGKVYFTGNTFFKIDAIQKERHGIGIPIIKLPLGFSDVDKALAEDLGRNLRTNERAHIVLPENWTVEFAELGGNPVDCMPSIKFHTDQIMYNILVPFYDDPSSREDTMGMYYKATRYIALTIADTFNKYVIKQLVDFNFKRGKYPILRARRIGEYEDARTVSFTLRNMVGAGLITPDDVLEGFIRRELDLPPMDEATSRQIVQNQQKEEDKDEEPAGPDSNKPQAPKPSRTGLPRQKSSPPVGLPKANAGRDSSGGG